MKKFYKIFLFRIVFVFFYSCSILHTNNSCACSVSLGSNISGCSGDNIILTASYSGGGCNNIDSLQWFKSSLYIRTTNHFSLGIDSIVEVSLGVGSYNYFVIIFDAGNPIDTDSVIVSINPSVGTPTTIGFSGTEPTCQIVSTTTTSYSTTAANSSGFNWSISNPLAGSINPSSGVMSWSIGFFGSVNIQVTANGCNGPSSQVIRTVTISQSVGVPAFSQGPTSSRCQGSGTVTYTATSVNNTSITYSLDATSLGAGCSINSSTGAVIYTAGYTGSSIITASASGCNGPQTSTHTVTIGSTVGTPTTIGHSGAEPTCQIANAMTTSYSTTAPNSSGFNWTVSNLSAGSINPSTGVMTWTIGFFGSVNIQVTANGCNGPSSQVIRTVTILPSVGVPSFTLGLSSVRCQGVGTIAYTATCVNNTGITYSLDATSLSAGCSINTSTGAVTYTSGYTGTSVITASASGCNGPQTSSHTVTIGSTVGTPAPISVASGIQPTCQITSTTLTTYSTTAANSSGFNWSISNSLAGSINASTGAMNWAVGFAGIVNIIVTANGCNGPSAQVALAVNVNPLPAKPLATNYGVDSICYGTRGYNFGVTNPDSSYLYHWQTNPANATIYGDLSMYCSVDFPVSGTFSTVITVTNPSTGCFNTDTTTVKVNNTTAPDTSLIYLFTPGNILVCMNHTFDSYQWGYDDGASHLRPQILSGETYQDYIAGNTFDISNRYYWVVTKIGNCFTKSYYNLPPPHRPSYAPVVVRAKSNLDIDVFPNPSSEHFNLNFYGIYIGPISLTIFDVAGREIMNQIFSKQDIILTEDIKLDKEESGIYFARVVYDQNEQRIFKIMVK
jgi:hypothetical protein